MSCCNFNRRITLVTYCMYKFRSVYSATSSKSLSGATLLFEPCPALSTYNTEFDTSSMVDPRLVEWEVSISAVWVVIISVLSTATLFLLAERTLLLRALFTVCTFEKLKKPDTFDFYNWKWLRICLAWRKLNERVSLSLKQCRSRSLGVMHYGRYANGWMVFSSTLTLPTFSLFFRHRCYVMFRG